MTHDKLLDKIEAIDYWQEHFANRTFLKALRAVVELHKPVVDKPDQYTLEAKPYCGGCWDAEDEYYALRHFYPCPTIQAIEKELK